MRCRILLLVILALMGSCAPLAPAHGPTFDVEVLQPDRERHWYIPVMAKNTDFVCVETLPRYPNYCVSVGELRRRLVVQRVGP